MTDPAPVIDLIEAFRRSKTMFAAVAFGVFDRTPVDARTLASEHGADPRATELLLDACVSLGFLSRQDGTYTNLPVADAYLRRSSESTLAGYILYSNDALFPMWSHLEDAVREASPRWAQVFGGDKGIFDHFFRTEEAKRDFLLGMHGFGRISSPAVVTAFDLGRYRRLVDLGGASGHLAAAAAARYPQLTAAVFDLPAAIEFARGIAPPHVQLIAGDFFRDPLPKADVYALGRILHDWPDEKCARLLAAIHDALPEGGAILLAEMLLDDDKAGPVPALMQSLNMLVCTEGRERSLEEFRVLLESAGFIGIEGRRTGKPLDAVIGWKRA